MNDIVGINQKSTLGSNGTQIGVQNIYNGITANDAVQMAIKMFKEYYPELKHEAISEVQRLVNEKLSNEPSVNIVPPTPRITVPLLQNASITEEKEIRELYANLLANSMKKVVKKGVHPSFVEIIKQLSPDEAKIIQYFFIHNEIPIITLRFTDSNGNGIDIIKKFSNIGELVDCERPLEINKYFNNLVRLGLVEYSSPLSYLIDEKEYEQLETHPYIVQQSKNARFYQKPYNTVDIVKGFITITDFGKDFCKVCTNYREITIECENYEF